MKYKEQDLFILVNQGVEPSYSWYIFQFNFEGYHCTKDINNFSFYGMVPRLEIGPIMLLDIKKLKAFLIDRYKQDRPCFYVSIKKKKLQDRIVMQANIECWSLL